MKINPIQVKIKGKCRIFALMLLGLNSRALSVGNTIVAFFRDNFQKYKAPKIGIIISK
jgi:hypothetical protein